MSFATRSAVVAALSALTVAQTSTTPKLTANCEDVVIFMARGNDAPYHDSRTFPLVDATCSKLRKQGKSCDFIEIEYDVTYGAPWCPQIAEGATNGVKQITAFNAKCPNTQIVVNGYSEGANVAGDVLAGYGGCDGMQGGIDVNSAAGKAISAALLWGDVRHTANQVYNVLDGADKGPYPRTGLSLEKLNTYSKVLRSYCAAGDPVCAGGDTVADHLNYFELYTDAASDFIVSKVDARAPASSAAPSSTAASSVASSVSASAPASTLVTSASGSAVTSASGTAPTASVSASAPAGNTTVVAPTYGSGYASASVSVSVSASSPAPIASEPVSVSKDSYATASSPAPASTESCDESSTAPAYGSATAPGYPAATPSGSTPSGSTPSGSTPSGSGYTTPNHGNGSYGATPPFPVPVPYQETCVVIPKIVYVYV